MSTLFKQTYKQITNTVPLLSTARILLSAYLHSLLPIRAPQDPLLFFRCSAYRLNSGPVCFLLFSQISSSPRTVYAVCLRVLYGAHYTHSDTQLLESL